MGAVFSLFSSLLSSCSLGEWFSHFFTGEQCRDVLFFRPRWSLFGRSMQVGWVQITSEEEPQNSPVSWKEKMFQYNATSTITH